MKPAQEKRSFYRIKDVIGLHCRLIDPAQDEKSAADADRDKPLSALLAEIDSEFNKAANILWQENPVIAKALGLLNRKLAIVTTRTLPEVAQEVDGHQEMTVSLSGSGIGFNSAQGFAQGARVHLSLVLRPSNITLSLTGIVAGCDPAQGSTDQQYWVRVTFDEGNEAAREQLIQHIVQRQVVQIREGEPAAAGEENGADGD